MHGNAPTLLGGSLRLRFGLGFDFVEQTQGIRIGFEILQVEVLEHSLVVAAAKRAYRCKQLVKPRRGDHLPGDELRTMLQLVFGLRP